MRWPNRICRWIPAVLTLALPAVSRVQYTYSLSAPSAGPRNGELELNISQTSKTGGKASFPPAGFICDKTLWLVISYRKLAERLSSDSLVVNDVVLDPNYPSTGQILLVTSAAYSLDVYTNPGLIVQVQFIGGASIALLTFSGGAGKTGGGKAQAGGSEPPTPGGKGGSGSGCNAGPAPQQPGVSYVNYCFSGIWVPQIGSHPLYSTNSNFSLAHTLGPGSFGLRAQEAADSFIVLDPNAFSSALFYQAVVTNHSAIPNLMGVLFNWNLATVEFDRKKKNTNLGTNVNLVTAPEFLFPVRTIRGFGTEVDAGIEYGHNFKNNIDPKGFGTVFRGLLGAQAMRIYAPAKHLKALSKIKVSSQYQLRLLAEDEVITKSHHGTLVPYKGHQARNWVTGEVDCMFTDNFGFTMKYEYGALPAGFIFVESRTTVGFTIQSAQK